MNESYFFIGVAGVGMSAIAQYLVGKGVAVSGSDRQFGEFLNGNAEKPLVRANSKIAESSALRRMVPALSKGLPQSW